MSVDIINQTVVTSISNPVAEIEVVTVQVPGTTGPTGPQGIPGSSNVLTIGTITTGAPGSSASATISGVSPTQTLNLTIPQGPQGSAGPANTLTIGTVTTVDAVTGGSATITGTSPNQTLNLTLPRGYGIIVGGAPGAVLVKNSTTDYDVAWSAPHTDATVSTIMTRDSAGRSQVVDPSASADISTKNYTDTQDTATRRVQANNVVSTTYTLQLSDEGKVVYYNADNSAVTITVPANSTTAFPIGTWIDIYQGATGQVTIQGGAGVVFRAADFGAATSSVTTRATYSKVRISKSNTDTWQVWGDFTNNASAAIAGSTSLSTASTLVKRDANGRASVADPSASTDIATKNYADTKAAIAGDLGGTAAAPTVTGGTHHTHTSTQISDAASANTASKVVIRDASARAQFADPSAAQDAATKNYADTQDKALRRPSVSTPTANYTLALADERTLVAMNASTALTLTVPLNSSVAFPVGTIIDVMKFGTGNVTIAGSAGVTILNSSALSVISIQNAVVRLIKAGTPDTWILQGLISASAVSAATASALVIRDTNGRAQVADPSASGDIATKNYVDGKTWASSTISDAASAATVSVVMKRDAAGRAQVVDPSASADIATKNYVDTQNASIAALPAGSTITVLKSAGVWPARPTSRTDIIVAWKGPDPSPSIVSSGTGGMLDNVDYRLITA